MKLSNSVDNKEDVFRRKGIKIVLAYRKVLARSFGVRLQRTRPFTFKGIRKNVNVCRVNEKAIYLIANSTTIAIYPIDPLNARVLGRWVKSNFTVIASCTNNNFVAILDCGFERIFFRFVTTATNRLFRGVEDPIDAVCFMEIVRGDV